MSGSILAMFAAFAAAPPAAVCSHLPVPSATVAEANDNRAPAGTLVGDELTLRLVVGLASWYPDGPEGCGIDVLAFAEEGGALRIPGPLIRVRAGTRVRVVVENTSDHALLVRGLQDRPAERLDSTLIAAGDTHMFEFQATTPGSYFYWARKLGSTHLASGDDGQLAGALVVDPPNGPTLPDRILVLTRWSPPGHLPLGHLPESDPATRRFELNVINGLSWPNTERLTYTTGDVVRLRVINAAGDAHVMHLHGFHYRVTSRGDNSHDLLFPPGEGPLLVSEILTPGSTITIEWVPTRPGNWIFHCHLQRHMSAGQRLDRIPGAQEGAHGGHAGDLDPGVRADHQGVSGHEMAGLILGITVDAATDYVATDDDPRHRIRLFANARDGVFGERPGYGFVVQEGDREPAPDSVRIPGSPLLLRQGEPTEIVVHNRIGKPLSVHWHGLEIESYFDGVAGWSGHADRIAPPIAPGDSFTVRITPPRAGTFIYHVHGGGPLDLASGLYGAFIVLDANAPRSLPETDRLFILSRLPGNDTATVVNGTRHPGPVDVRSGETYRFRIIGIMPQEGDFITLRDPAGIARWELMARDGVEGSTARLPGVSAGMTMDFGLTASAAGALMLEIQTLDLVGQRLGSPIRIPVRVRDQARERSSGSPKLTPLSLPSDRAEGGTDALRSAPAAPRYFTFHRSRSSAPSTSSSKDGSRSAPNDTSSAANASGEPISPNAHAASPGPTARGPTARQPTPAPPPRGRDGFREFSQRDGQGPAMTRFTITMTTCLLALAACGDAPRPSMPDGVDFHVTHLAIGDSDRLGLLRLSGAVAMQSRDESFGSYSGLHVSDDGRRLVAIGWGGWLTGRLRYGPAGNLTGFELDGVFPLRDEAGRPITNDADRDAESLVERDGYYYVGFETNSRVARYGGIDAAGEPVHLPPEELAAIPQCCGFAVRSSPRTNRRPSVPSTDRPTGLPLEVCSPAIVSLVLEEHIHVNDDSAPPQAVSAPIAIPALPSSLPLRRRRIPA